MPIMCGCFCDNCLIVFEEEFGIKYTRNKLKDTFNNGDIEAKLNGNLDYCSKLEIM
jgi:hypothetical protein